MRRWWLVGAACALTVGGAPAIAGSQALAAGAPVLAGATQSGSNVLLVCNGSTKPCPPGMAPVFSTVQSAVNAASPGAWILIWPGVYHEKSTQWPTAGVWIQKPGLHIRGLDRNGVIIDGSNGTASKPCPSSPALQDTNGGVGRDGIVVWKASGVTIQNLTVCDYLSGTGGHGNEIWWNGGDGSGKIGMGAYTGSYLSATSMFGPSDVHNANLAQYGVFVSNAHGPGVIEESYASNMADSSYYVGACQRVCHATLKHDVGTNSNLGYSGTNAGGPLVIEDSVFSRNRAGIVPNSLNNDDAPPPQNGACPGGTTSCFFIEHNVIKNNNNPNVPTSGHRRGHRHGRGDLRRRVRHGARQPDHPQRLVGRGHARLPGHRDAAARVALPGRHPGFPAAVRLPGARQQGLRQLLLRRRVLRQRHQQRPRDRGAAADLRDTAELLLRQP